MSRLRQSRVLPPLVLVAGLAVQTLYALHLAGRLWFFGDDWDFLLQRSLTGHSDYTLWQPHNEHWSTVPIVLFRLVFAVVGLSSYLPYAFLPIAMHLAIWLLVYALLRDMDVERWPAAVATWVGAFLAGGVGAENTLWDFQVGFLGSAAFGLLALWFLRRTGIGHLAGAWVALVLSLGSSGIGVLFVGWAALSELLRRGWWRAIAVGSVPGAIYVLWYLLIGHTGHSGIPVDRTLFPLLTMEGLDAIWSRAFASPGAGVLVLVILAAVVFLRPQPERAFALAASGLGALVVAFALFGLARSGLGEGSATASRYLYHGFVFCAPAVGLTAQWVTRRLRDDPLVRLGVLGVVLGGSAALGLAHLSQFADDRRDTVDGMQEQFAATVELIDRGESFASGRPSPKFNPNVTVQLLRPVRADLRSHVSAQELVEARGVLQVRVHGPGSREFPPARSVEWDGFKAPPAAAAAAKCETRRAQDDANLDVPVPRAGAWLRLKTDDNSEIRTRVVDGKRESDGRGWPDVPDGFVNVESTAAGKHLRIEVPEGDVTVCRGAQPRG